MGLSKPERRAHRRALARARAAAQQAQPEPPPWSVGAFKSPRTKNGVRNQRNRRRRRKSSRNKQDSNHSATTYKPRFKQGQRPPGRRRRPDKRPMSRR